MTQTKPTRRRCAIYTRKSTEEGLDQAFNSLDAQREACEAFAKSQAHEGWQVSPDHYDDGGFSGGTMERPALTRLLDEIHSRQIDIVIVYKVDRLSRSLADFVRLIELFDKTGISFVSVTQQFNTSTSMGRLTLNVLLSFAQFEREVTSERIRDKIAASKKKGMWMGGLVPLGYDRIEKQLVVNEGEAETVRHIYQRYEVLGCVRELKAELDHEGFLSKARPEHHKLPGQKPFSRGALYTILKNPVYAGKVHHKGELHDGKHAAIVDTCLWNTVQTRLTHNRREKQAKTHAKYPSLLGGLVFDDKGYRMSPTYTRRKNRHYAYYVSQAVLQYKEGKGGSVLRIPAKELEDTVLDLVCALLNDPHRIIELLSPYALPANALDAAVESAKALGNDLSGTSIKKLVAEIQELVKRVDVAKNKIRVELSREKLIAHLTAGLSDQRDMNIETESEPFILSAEVTLKRSGIEAKLIYPEGTPASAHSRSVKALQRALFKSLEWNQAMITGEVATFEELIRRDDLNPRQTHRLRQLAFLAPEIIDRIASGDIPEKLTLERMKKDFPLDWKAQYHHFGLKPSQHT